MSDTENEPIEETTPDVEPEEEPTEEPEEAEEEAPEPEPEPEPESTDARDDVEIDAVYTQVGKKAKNYIKGLVDLTEGKGLPIAPCEMCADCYPGVRWLQAQDDMHAVLLGVIGAGPNASPLLEDPDARQCERCGGWGATRLPSHTPGNEQRVCKACNGAGYLDPNPQSGAMQAPAPEPVNGELELLPGVPEYDPSVADLRARGYMVVPPMRLPQGTEG